MNIAQLRKKIDALDLRMLKILEVRAQAARRIGRLKAKNNTTVYVPPREKKIIAQLLSQSSLTLAPEAIEAVFREVINACRGLESRIKVAYMGPEATFTHKAAVKNFGAGAEYSAVKSVADVFNEVEKQRAHYGVVPVENSTEGAVNHTLDMFIDSELSICAEVSMQIEECLLSKTGKRDDIKVILSHPQPIAQCRAWLEGNFPGVPVRETASTAQAALLASKDKTAAAIASSTAADLYGLNFIARGIEDSRENFTRFLVIGRAPSEPSGYDKTSIMFSIKDRVGGLYDMLQPFKRHKINLTKIESRPTKRKAWQYIFFIDFIGHVKEPRVQKALKELSTHAPFIKILGSYPRAD